SDIEDGVGGDVKPIGVGSDDGQLELGVEAAHIQCGICFGESELLCLPQCGVVGEVFVEYFGKDIVGRTIEYPRHGVQQFVVVIFFEIPDDGDTSANGTLVQQAGAVLVLDVYQFLQVCGNHFLVCRHHVLARAECACYDFKRRIGVVNQLNDGVDLRVVQYGIRVGGEKLGRQAAFFLGVLDNEFLDG